MFGFRNILLSASSLAPACDVGNGWQLAEPVIVARRASRDLPLWRMTAAIVCLLGMPVAANAGATFTQPDLATGSTYRLAFITSDPTTATSSDIATYNSFAASEAALNTSLPSTTWSAIASAGSTSAVMNLDASCTGSCLTDPIYLVDGTTVVATSQGNLFGGTILNQIIEDENGNPSSAFYVWTGSTSAGGISPNGALGAATAQVGSNLSPLTYGYVLQAGNLAFDTTGLHPIYAISGELTVVPEPVSGSLLLVGGAATGLVRRLRRKRQSAV